MQSIKTKYEIIVEGEVAIYGDMFSEIAYDNGLDELDSINNTINDLSLSSGHISFKSRSFEVAGKTKSGNTLCVTQFGNYGFHIEPKMGKILVQVNGEDISNKVIAEFIKWFGGDIPDDAEIDLSRTDIWGSIIK